MKSLALILARRLSQLTRSSSNYFCFSFSSSSLSPLSPPHLLLFEMKQNLAWKAYQRSLVDREHLTPAFTRSFFPRHKVPLKNVDFVLIMCKDSFISPFELGRTNSGSRGVSVGWGGRFVLSFFLVPPPSDQLTFQKREGKEKQASANPYWKMPHSQCDDTDIT